MERICIRGGAVYDGTGRPAVRADVLVENGRIAAVAPGLEAGEARIIDAAGCAVTPGFVDIHRHCDIAPMRDAAFGEAELAQGITTTVAGNCGLAPVPFAGGADGTAFADSLEPVIGPMPETLRFARYAGYTAALQKAPLPLNMGFLAAAGAIRCAAAGFSPAPMSAKERARAAAYVEEAMQAGARGVSLGIMYRPECYTTPEEYDALLAPAARRGGILCTHIRGEGDNLVASVREVIGIAARAGIALNISHFKATGIRNWGSQILRAAACIDEARAKGQPVTADFYPYEGGSTTLLSLLPPQLLEEYPDPRSFETAAAREALRAALEQDIDGWDNMAKSIGWERIRISSAALPANRRCEGKSLDWLAEEAAVHPADVVARLLAEEGGRTGIIVMSMDWADVCTVARLPYTALISDALYGGGSSLHPRLYGAFPRFLRQMVIQDRLLPMEEAVAKMTLLPSERMGFAGRGRLCPGAVADVAFFDPAAFRDTATYEQPRRTAVGLRSLLIAGRTVLAEDQWNGICAGRFLPKQ